MKQRECRSSTWRGSLSDAINDIEVAGAEIAWQAGDLYEQTFTGRHRLRAIQIADKTLKVLDELTALRQAMGLQPRKAGD